MFEIISYVDPKGRAPIEDYISGLTERQQNKVIAFIRRLEQMGYNLRRPIADSLGGGLALYELRPGRHRIVYFFHDRNKIILLHAFFKTTNEIPRSEICIALKRKRDYEEN